MHVANYISIQIRAAAMGVAACALLTGSLMAQGAEDLRLTVGKSVVIDYPSDIRQISTSNPDTARAWSRMISGPSRNRGPRASKRFSGSLRTSSGETCDDCL